MLSIIFSGGSKLSLSQGVDEILGAFCSSVSSASSFRPRFPRDDLLSLRRQLVRDQRYRQPRGTRLNRETVSHRQVALIPVKARYKVFSDSSPSLPHTLPRGENVCRKRISFTVLGRSVNNEQDSAACRGVYEARAEQLFPLSFL